MAIKATALITLTRVNDGAKGDRGPQGVQGNDGKGIKSTEVTYQIWANGTSTPTGAWSSTPPKTTADKPYLWTKTVLTYTDNTSSPPSYSIGATPEGVEEKVDKNIRDQISASEKTTETKYNSAIEQKAKSIELRVDKTEQSIDKTNNTVKGISNTVDLNTKGLGIVQSRYEQIQNALDGTMSKTEVQEWARFDGANLELGASNQPFKCRLSTIELAFYQSQNKVAWISNNELHVLRAIIAESIGCGSYRFVDEGDLGFSLI